MLYDLMLKLNQIAISLLIYAQYILEGGPHLVVSRIFWFVMVISAASIGIHFSIRVSYLFSDKPFQ